MLCDQRRISTAAYSRLKPRNREAIKPASDARPFSRHIKLAARQIEEATVGDEFAVTLLNWARSAILGEDGPEAARPSSECARDN